MTNKTQDKDSKTVQKGSVKSQGNLKPFEPAPAEVRKAYEYWISQPSEKREPKTKQEFALLHGITDRTLYNWEHDPLFADEVRLLIRQNAIINAPDVINHVKKRALGEAGEGSARHAELFLENVAGFGKRQEIDVTTRQEKTNTAELLTSGRMAEQLEGILTHLQRKEQAVEAEYSVIPDAEGDIDTPKEGEN